MYDRFVRMQYLERELTISGLPFPFDLEVSIMLAYMYSCVYNLPVHTESH